MRMQHLHPTDELLELYVMNTIPTGEEEYVEEHLLVCELCRIRLEKTEAVIRVIRATLG